MRRVPVAAVFVAVMFANRNQSNQYLSVFGAGCILYFSR